MRGGGRETTKQTTNPAAFFTLALDSSAKESMELLNFINQIAMNSGEVRWSASVWPENNHLITGLKKKKKTHRAQVRRILNMTNCGCVRFVSTVHSFSLFLITLFALFWLRREKWLDTQSVDLWWISTYTHTHAHSPARAQRSTPALTGSLRRGEGKRGRKKKKEEN